MQESGEAAMAEERAPLTSAQTEWRQSWKVVAACAVGFSIQTVPTYTLGLMMDPLGREFGWGRAQISLASLIPAIMMVTLAPFVGAGIDKWGSRRIALPSVLLTGLSIALIGQASGSVAQWGMLWLFYAIVSLGTKASVWTTVIAGTFTSSRGLALGVALTGAGLTQVLVPPIAQWLIDGSGWRMAYFWLGLGWGLVGFALVYFWLRDSRPNSSRDPGTGLVIANKGSGLTVPQAIRSFPLIRIALATLLTMFIGTAILIHQVPILVEAGLDRSTAALLASLSGVATIVGKLSSGWMVDRWHAGRVGVVTLLAPAIAYLMLLYGGSAVWIVVMAMIIIGYTTGAKYQISAYLTGQYAGMRNYGTIFGIMTSMIGIGGGFGTVAAGAVYDRFGSYDAILWLGILLRVVSSALIVRLGAPKWVTQKIGT